MLIDDLDQGLLGRRVAHGVIEGVEDPLDEIPFAGGPIMITLQLFYHKIPLLPFRKFQ